METVQSLATIKCALDRSLNKSIGEVKQEYQFVKFIYYQSCANKNLFIPAFQQVWPIT